MEKVILKTVIEYLSGNDNVLKLIKQIALSSGINGYVSRVDDNIVIIAEGTEEELGHFMENLGSKMPYSIFMRSSKTEIAQEQDIEEGFYIKNEELNIIPLNLSTCISCLDESLVPSNRRFFYPFISCNHCGSQYAFLFEYPFEREKTVYKFFQPCENCKKEYENKDSLRYKYELISCPDCFAPVFYKSKTSERIAFTPEEREKLFNALAGIIAEGKLLKIKTTNGYKVIGTIHEENTKKIREIENLGRKPITVLLTDISKLENIAHYNQLQLNALSSQEKPVISLQGKAEFLEKNLVSQTEFIMFKLPDEPILNYLAFFLKERGIPYVFIQNLSEENKDKIKEGLEFDLPVVNLQKETEVFTVNGRIYIKEGEKGILPAILKSKPVYNISVAGDYVAVPVDDGEYLVDKKEKILPVLDGFLSKAKEVRLLNGNYEHIKIPYENIRDYKDYEGALYSVVAEHNRLNEPFVGIYLSSKSDNSCFAVRSHTKSLTQLIKIRPVLIFDDFYKTVKWALKEIENMSEEGERLIQNYSKKYPDIFKKLENIEINEEEGRKSENLTAIMNLISIILGAYSYEDVTYFNEPAEIFENAAIDYPKRKALKVDFFLQEADGIFYLDWRTTIRSLISYRIAGTDIPMLSYSFFEGLGEWIVSQSEIALSKLKINNLVLAGDTFSNPVITGRVLKHLRNRNILLNERLPVDVQNIAFGGLFVE
ncbi:Kae1-like domain-containing protein [Persephonella sp.]